MFFVKAMSSFSEMQTYNNRKHNNEKSDNCEIDSVLKRIKVKIDINEELSYRIPRRVRAVLEIKDGDNYSICPKCKCTMERDYQSFCDRCGQKLNWDYFEKAKVIKWTPYRKSRKRAANIVLKYVSCIMIRFGNTSTILLVGPDKGNRH